MSQFHATSHDLSNPADILLQAVVTAERRLTVITASLPMHMVQDKILSGLSSAHSFIITLLQVESPQRDVIKAASSRQSRRADSSHSHSHSHSSAGKEFDWTNTKNRMDVCYRCGLPGHFAQYCVSVMPDDVRRRIIRNRERQAQLAEDEASDIERGVATTVVDTSQGN
ncbi:hypothetical protein B0H14DRAFT_3881103 [Mycena olivaceomarginata]|nr:hypothetical protein B0H14DRAFT_3881103 [Mycena olivaceomarginata]